MINTHIEEISTNLTRDVYNSNATNNHFEYIQPAIITISIRENNSPKKSRHMDLNISFQLIAHNSSYPSVSYIATSDICNGIYDIVMNIKSNICNVFDYTLTNNTKCISYNSIATSTINDTSELIFSNVGAGSYKFDVTNSDNKQYCLFEIIEPSLCSVSLISNVFYLRCNGDKIGIIKAVIHINNSNKWRTGTITHEYMWMIQNDTKYNYLDPSTKTISQNEVWSDISTLTNMEAGKYIVNVRQICTSINKIVTYSSVITDTIEICQPKQLHIKLYPNTCLNLTHYGDISGKIRFWTTGGTLPYEFLLFKYEDNGTLLKVDTYNTYDSVSGLKAGVYKMVLIDYTKCEKSIDFEITQPLELSAQL